MNKTLLLALVAALFMVADVSAQSGSKPSGSSSKQGSSTREDGSSSKGNANVSAMKKKMERLEAKQIAKIARQIQKDNFAGIKLVKAQKNELKELVMANFKSLTQFDTQIQGLIPKDKVKDLRKGYTASKRKGNSEAESMMMSMKSVGISEMVQEKVMQVRTEKDELVQEIVAGVSEMLDDDQKKMMMAKAEEKEKMMEKKMSDKEMKEMKDKKEMGTEVTSK